MTPTTDLLPALDTEEQVRAYIAGRSSAAFKAADAARSRPAHHLGLSGLGGCTKQAAYAIAGTPASDEPLPEEGRAANLGTWEHAGFLPVLASIIPGARYEVDVTLRAAGLTIPGHVDLDFADVVLDLKTVGEYRLHGVRRNGAYADHRVQVMAYALARMQAGRPVRWVVWLYLDRANGSEEIAVERFTNAAAMAVIDRAAELRTWSVAPDRAPRDGRGPGLSLACDGCHWLRRCWGETAHPGVKGPQRVLAADESGKVDALALYDDASQRASAARRDQEFAKLMLDGTPKGQYGPWSLRRGKEGDRLDESAAVALIEELGHKAPKVAQAGRLLIRLTEALSKSQRKQMSSDEVPDTA